MLFRSASVSVFPTLETRICDVQPALEDTLTLAALIQALTRMLHRLAKKNQRWRIYDRFLVDENRWRAQRYGTSKGLIDLGRREIVSLPDLMDEMLEVLGEDAEACGALAEVERVRDMAQETSAARQRALFQKARIAGQDREEALRDVVRHLVEEFHRVRGRNRRTTLAMEGSVGLR